MPGIVGLVTKLPRQQAEAQLLQMVQTLKHEPSYVTGTWANEDMGVYVGWVARKDAFSSRMPLFNESQSVCLVFSGEEYSDPGNIQRLRERGHRFEPDGPAYLPHLYEEDNRFPAGLNGRFQGLLTDQERGTVTLFNDRYGLHRLYFHEANGAFYFAGEAKAILAVRPELRSINLKSLGEWISCGCVLEDRTLFEGIQVLPAGSVWKFEESALRQKAKYFCPSDWENQERLEPEAYYQTLREVFSRILPRYFSGRQAVGVSLTGGLDTRMIMAWQRSAPATLPCYSFGGIYRDCEDVLLARRIAGLCGQTYEVIPVGDKFLSEFAHYAERAVYMTDGCVTVTRAADLYANEFAAQIAPVRMTGNYGSEILRRLRAFKPVGPAPGIFTPEIEQETKIASVTYSQLLQTHAVSFIAFRQMPWHHYGNVALEETQVSMRSPFVDNEIVQTAFRAPDSTVVKSDIFADSDDCIRLIQDGNARLQGIPTDRGLNGGSALSRAYLEFTFKAEYAYDYGMPQWLARVDHLLSPLHLERAFLGRHKFCHYRVWYRDQLSDYVRDMLLDSKALSRPYLNRKSVERIVNGHITGRSNYTSEIHKLLTLEYIYRLFAA